jgi:fermentation-respiration switch protein FrsA (DUF1100 family)
VTDFLPDGQEITLTTSDGVALPLWWIAPEADDPAPAVLLLHGAGGSRADLWPTAASLHTAGLGVAIAEYRGYGGAGGTPSERGFAADGRAALAWLRTRPEIDAARITLVGVSLGAAVAAHIAVEDPVAAVVLRSPFTSLHAVAQRKIRWIPYTALLRSDFRTIDRIQELEVPLLVAAGTDDDLIPIGQSRAVYERAQSPKRLLILEGTGHYDSRWQLDADFLSAVAALARNPGALHGQSTITLAADWK